LKKNQKSQIASNVKLADDNGTLKKRYEAGTVFVLSKHDSHKIKIKKAGAWNDKMIKYTQTNKKKSALDRIDYSDICRVLRKIQESKAVEYKGAMDTPTVPYEIPDVYSLKQEAGALEKMKKRMNVFKIRLEQSEVEALSSDWEKIGGDVDAALCRYGNICARKGE
jgi:hypothetical protein